MLAVPLLLALSEPTVICPPPPEAPPEVDPFFFEHAPATRPTTRTNTSTRITRLPGISSPFGRTHRDIGITRQAPPRLSPEMESHPSPDPCRRPPLVSGHARRFPPSHPRVVRPTVSRRADSTPDRRMDRDRRGPAHLDRGPHRL